MANSRFKSIVENLEGALAMRRPSVKTETVVTETSAGTREDPLAGARRDLRQHNEAIDKLGHKLALVAFGKALDQMPSRVESLAGAQPQEFSKELTPYMESYARLTKPLYESVATPIYREDIERATLLYVACEITGRTFEQMMRLDDAAKNIVIEQEFGHVVGDPQAEKELMEGIVSSLANAGANIVKGVGNVASGAVKDAGKVVSSALPGKDKDESRNPSGRSLTESQVFVGTARSLIQEKYMGFAALKAKIASRGGTRDPGAVAAAIGRRKYGKGKFQAAAAAGRKMRDIKPKT